MNGNPSSILIIDDEEPMALGLKTLLEREGYRVTTSNNGMDGIRLAQETLPHLIVCDIMMPKTDGFAVGKKLSENPATRNIPFLFLSARIGQTDKLRGLGSGADDYITKPFDPRELVARIEAVFRRHERGRASAEQEINRQIERIQAEISNNLSHELRTPMTQILFGLEMILRDKYEDPEEIKRFVETALSQSNRLNALIDDLLFLGNLDMKRAFGLRQKINLETDFKQTIAARQELYKEKNLRLQIQIEEGVMVHAPRREFRQAVRHLADNGLKFAPPMTSVLIELAANGEGGGVLTVTDYGAGIPAELREKVFERYYQISQGDTRQYGGLGVGLTIARSIARTLGGDVAILPSERGCRVQMTIPPAPSDML